VGEGGFGYLVIDIWVIGDYWKLACLPQAGDLVIGI